MKKEIADLWVKALRSGKYKQTKGKLKDEFGYCCLGVLCDISKLDSFKDNRYLDQLGILPEEVKRWSGIKDRFGSLYHESLSGFNDDGESFEEIANIIEKNWEII